jgi:hypothetical protein
MKRTIALLFAVLLALSGVVSTANAVSVSIAVGDRPYYVHGPVYFAGPVRYVWVPGHHVWRHHHRVWIHGYYTVG